MSKTSKIKLGLVHLYYKSITSLRMKKDTVYDVFFNLLIKLTQQVLRPLSFLPDEYAASIAQRFGFPLQARPVNFALVATHGDTP